MSGLRKRSMPSIGDNDETESVELVAHRMGLIAPRGPRKGQWDWFVLLLVLYTAVSVPFTLAFVPFTTLQNSALGFSFDVLVDLSFIADVFVSWRTTFYNREGVLVLDKKKARDRYLRTWFLPDVIASIPFRHISSLITMNSPADYPAWKLPALLKLTRFFRLGTKIDRLSTAKIFRIFQFTVMLLMAAHWYACVWFWMGQGQPPDPVKGIMEYPGQEGTSWVYRLRLENETTEMQYTASVYWALTTLMKSPWFHPTSPTEFIGAAIMIIFGCVLFAYFLGNVTAVITAANAAGGRYRTKITELKNFCASYGIDPKLASKLLVYQDAMWAETFGGTDVTAMTKTLPPHLLPQVTMQIYKRLLDACPFLYDCTAWGCTTFLQALKIQVCERGDHLLVAGSVSPIMYILSRGEVKINFMPEAPWETAEYHVPGGRIGGTQVRKTKVKDGKDAMRGRTDKMGTLLNFHDVSAPLTKLEYGVVALSRCSLFSISRAELKAILTTYDMDKEHFERAVTKATETIRGGNRRSSTRMLSSHAAEMMNDVLSVQQEDVNSPAKAPDHLGA
jgi:hypothetical protein